MFRLAVLLSALQGAALAFQPTSTRARVSTLKLHQTRLSDNDDAATAGSYQTSDRRAFLGSSLALLLVDAATPFQANADDDAVDYKAVAADIEDLIKADPDKGPTMIRVAWHSSGK